MKKIIPEGDYIIPDDAKRVYEGILFDVYQWQQEMFDGSFATYEGLKRADSALTIGIDENHRLILVEDAQPHKRTTVRLPGGRVDADDSSILDAAKREMLEETGYEFQNWRLVHVKRVTSKIDWFIYFYLAYDVSSRGRQNYDDGGEKISMLSLSFEEALEKAEHDDEYGILHRAGTLEGLLAMPEYAGRSVDVEPKIEHL